MKITRLARGYRISCSDPEFELLRFLTGRGLIELPGYADTIQLSAPVRRALHGLRFKNSQDLLWIDVDRRAMGDVERLRTIGNESGIPDPA